MSLGKFFERCRMMAAQAAEKGPKYVWAVYDFAYVRDDANITTGSGVRINGSKKAATSYTVSGEGFTLVNPTYGSSLLLKKGQYIVDISTSNSTATSGQYLYELTENAYGAQYAYISYKRYGVKEAKGTTELYRVESDTLDYPVDGEQDGLWYVLVEGEM